MWLAIAGSRLKRSGLGLGQVRAKRLGWGFGLGVRVRFRIRVPVRIRVRSVDQVQSLASFFSSGTCQEDKQENRTLMSHSEGQAVCPQDTWRI